MCLARHLGLTLSRYYRDWVKQSSSKGLSGWARSSLDDGELHSEIPGQVHNKAYMELSRLSADNWVVYYCVRYIV
jgi:phage gp29-like protein